MRALIAILLYFAAIDANAQSEPAVDISLELEIGAHTSYLSVLDANESRTLVVTGSSDGTIRIWSGAEGKMLKTIWLPRIEGGRSSVRAISISPDNSTVAAGGITTWKRESPRERLFFFSASDGTMIHYIDDLPSFPTALDFADNGEQLAVGLNDGSVYILRQSEFWALGPRAFKAQGAVDAIVFDNAARLLIATGQSVRLYDMDAVSEVAIHEFDRLVVDLALSPSKELLAVALGGKVPVVLKAADLSHLFSLDLTISNRFRPSIDANEAGVSLRESLSNFRINDDVYVDVGEPVGGIGSIEWSADGKNLIGQGASIWDFEGYPIFSWSSAGRGEWEIISTVDYPSAEIMSTPDGGLIVATGEPWLGRLARNNTPIWTKRHKKMRPLGQHKSFSVSDDGSIVDFGFEEYGERRARFDLSKLRLTLGEHQDGITRLPRLDGMVGLKVEPSVMSFKLETQGNQLDFGQPLVASSYAVHPNGGYLFAGTNRDEIRAFDQTGALIWKTATASEAKVLNVSFDGRLLISGHTDGTISWRRTRDGVELLKLFPFESGEWIAWTPDGHFVATPGARGSLGFIVTYGWEEAARFIPAGDVPGLFDAVAIANVTRTLSVPLALGFSRQLTERKRLEQISARRHADQ